MSDFRSVNPREIEGRTYSPIALQGGLDQETSKFSVYPGTLEDVLNYNSSTRGYQRAQGLFYYDGTIDGAVSNMWMVNVDDSESSLVGSGFTLGGQVTWDGGESSARCVYYERFSAATDYTMLGIVEILGTTPAAGDVLTDAESGTTWTLGGSLSYPPAELASARNPSTGALVVADITAYLSYLNDTVNANLVAQTDVVSGTYNTYHGAVPGVGPITGGWQFEDEVYVVRDTYAIEFSYGSDEFRPGEEVLVPLDVGTEQVMVIKVVLTSGYWASGTASGYVLFAPSTSTSDFRALDNIDDGGAAYIKTLASSNMARVDSTANQYGGIVWKATINGWEWVDTGWTIEYDTGTNVPNVKAAPLFLPDLISASRNTGATATAAGSEEGSAPYITWTTPGNITADDTTNTTCALGSGETSRYLKAQIPASILPQTDVRVIGVEVTVNAEYTGANAPIDTDVRLVNEASGASFYLSDNRARRESLTGADADYVYGGSSDTFGVESISADDIASGDVYALIQYSNETAGAGQAEVDYVSFNIYYVPNTEKVWFYDGSSDVSTGVINALQIDSGDFASNKAAGNMTFSTLSAPEDIGVGMSMYSEASGGGVLIADVTVTPSYNVLPSADQLEAEESLFQVIKANYYENDDSESIYGVTGAGPAFGYDGEVFSLIKTPLTRSVDKPRHIAFHDNRLALGFESGHVVLSAIAVPNDFSAINSASSWGVGDRVTGLISLPGNVLGVFSESSIRTLEGSSEDTGTMRTVSSTTGCKEYTMQNITGPYYADNRGIGSLQTSDKYGDFDMGRLSESIRTWIQDRMQEKRTTQTLDISSVTSVAVRNKNQYRLFFEDGYILVMYFRANGAVEPTLMHYDTENFSTNYVPSFIDSTILSNGKERVVMGTKSGEVYIVDGADAIIHPNGNSYPNCYVVTNPINFGKPESVHKHYHVLIQGRFLGAQTVSTWGDSNYEFDETGSAHYTVTFGDYTDTPIFEARAELDSAYLPIIADGFTMKMQTTMDGSKPHTFQSLMFRASTKGTDRNRTEKAY